MQIALETLADLDMRLGCNAFAVDGHGSNALHYAADSFNVEIVQLFLAHRANPGARDSNNVRPLDHMNTWKTTSLNKATCPAQRAGVHAKTAAIAKLLKPSSTHDVTASRFTPMQNDPKQHPTPGSGSETVFGSHFTEQEILKLKQEFNDDAGLASREGIVTVARVFQTHDCISGHFTDGRLFCDLINALDFGKVDPMTSPFLKLDVFDWPGKGFFSIRNRRLFCLKKKPSRKIAMHPGGS